MKRPHTHYDNLKVARDAPPEVIRAAYKSLSQKYHPDRNPGNTEAARIMTLINASYDVLADPAKRREHDRWVAQQEAIAVAPASVAPPQTGPARSSDLPGESAAAAQPDLSSLGRRLISVAVNYWGIYFLLSLTLFVLYSSYDGSSSVPPPERNPYAELARPMPMPLPMPRHKPTPSQLQPQYVRPMLAPNGKPWPTTAGLLAGFPRLNGDGHSKVTVDNSQNDSDVYLKLVSLNGQNAYAARVLFLPARSRFTLMSLTPGSYDVRYQNLTTGALVRTETFSLTEHPTYDAGWSGIQYTTLSLLLQKGRDGNAQTYPLTAAEF